MEHNNHAPPFHSPNAAAEAIARHQRVSSAALAIARHQHVSSAALARLTATPPRHPPRWDSEATAPLNNIATPVMRSLAPSVSSPPSPEVRGSRTTVLQGTEQHTSTHHRGLSFTEFRDRDDESVSSSEPSSTEFRDEDSVSSSEPGAGLRGGDSVSSSESCGAEFHNEDSAESSEADEMECCICLEEPTAEDVATIDGCEHKFCIDCVAQWSETRNICPLCRTRFTSIESAGGVYLRVPERRTAVTALTRAFNVEVAGGGPGSLSVLLQELRESVALNRDVTGEDEDNHEDLGGEDIDDRVVQYVEEGLRSSARMLELVQQFEQQAELLRQRLRELQPHGMDN